MTSTNGCGNLDDTCNLQQRVRHAGSAAHFFGETFRLRRSDVQGSSVSQDELLQTTISMHVHKYCAVRRPPLKRKNHPRVSPPKQITYRGKENTPPLLIFQLQQSRTATTDGICAYSVELVYISVLHCEQSLADLIGRLIYTAE